MTHNLLSEESFKSNVAIMQRLSNLNSIYNSSSPIFKELLLTLINEPFNETTQIKIEKIKDK